MAQQQQTPAGEQNQVEKRIPPTIDAGASGAAGVAAAAEAAKKRRERITFNVHHELDPLLSVLRTEPAACVSISGFGQEALKLESGNVSIQSDFSRPFAEKPTVSSVIKNLDDLKTMDTVISRNFWSPDTIDSTVKNQKGDVVEKRHSEIRPALFSPDEVDTTINDKDGQPKGSIHSDISSSGIDTIVKDAAGRKVVELTSVYDTNLFSADTLCTRLKP